MELPASCYPNSSHKTASTNLLKPELHHTIPSVQWYPTAPEVQSKLFTVSYKVLYGLVIVSSYCFSHITFCPFPEHTKLFSVFVFTFGPSGSLSLCLQCLSSSSSPWQAPPHHLSIAEMAALHRSPPQLPTVSRTTSCSFSCICFITIRYYLICFTCLLFVSPLKSYEGRDHV